MAKSLPWRFTSATALAASLACSAAQSRVQLVVLDSDNGRPVPCRVHLKDAAGKPVPAPGLPFWRDHFVCTGAVELRLAPGEFTYELERGPEYFVTTGKLTVAEGSTTGVTNELRRLVHLAREGWWSGETHVHRPLTDVELLLRAEDLHVAPVITWWNNANPWTKDPLPAEPLRRFDGDRFLHVLGGEDERGGGALLYFGLKEPLKIAGARREHPSPMKFLAEAKQRAGVWVDVEKPFWWDAPVWLASGLVDSVGIAHNHLHRGGVLDNEAWGRPRDRAKHPGPRGNGLWTQEIYYHALNCGLRVPPSAGSASGVLPNPVGYNRAYVPLDGELTWEKWWEGLRAGRVFVSNGPLLRARANGQLPGHVFKADGPLVVRLEARLDSRDPIEAVELVHNGRVERVTLPASVTIGESGWFLLRAIAAVPHTLRFAATGPWHVEVAGRPARVNRESAQFFLDWTRERMAALKLDDPQQREEVLEPMRAAEKFWADKLARAARAASGN